MQLWSARPPHHPQRAGEAAMTAKIEPSVPVSELMQALIKVANETASPMGSDSLSLAGKRLTMLENDIHKLIHRYQPAEAEHD